MIVHISLVVGWGALSGALFFMFLWSVPIFRLFFDVRQAQTHPGITTRAHVIRLFQMQQLYESLWTQHWLDRVKAVLGYYLMPICIGVVVGILCESVMQVL